MQVILVDGLLPVIDGGLRDPRMVGDLRRAAKPFHLELHWRFDRAPLACEPHGHFEYCHRHGGLGDTTVPTTLSSGVFRVVQPHEFHVDALLAFFDPRGAAATAATSEAGRKRLAPSRGHHAFRFVCCVTDEGEESEFHLLARHAEGDPRLRALCVALNLFSSPRRISISDETLAGMMIEHAVLSALTDTLARFSSARRSWLYTAFDQEDAGSGRFIRCLAAAPLARDVAIALLGRQERYENAFVRLLSELRDQNFALEGQLLALRDRLPASEDAKRIDERIGAIRKAGLEEVDRRKRSTFSAISLGLALFGVSFVDLLCDRPSQPPAVVAATSPATAAPAPEILDAPGATGPDAVIEHAGSDGAASTVSCAAGGTDAALGDGGAGGSPAPVGDTCDVPSPVWSEPFQDPTDQGGRHRD